MADIDDLPFFRRPIGARRDDRFATNELGEPIYQDYAGNEFAVSSPEPFAPRMTSYDPESGRYLANAPPDMGPVLDFIAGIPGAVTEAATMPRRAYEGDMMTYGDVGGLGLEVGLAGAPFRAPKGSTRMWASRNAVEATPQEDKLLDDAINMAMEGRNREEIFEATGWSDFSNTYPGGMWERPMTPFDFSPSIRKWHDSDTLSTMPAEGYWDDAIRSPWRERVLHPVNAPAGPRATLRLSNIEQGEIRRGPPPRIEALGPDLESLRDTLTHETQHYFDHLSGYNVGYNADFLDAIRGETGPRRRRVIDRTIYGPMTQRVRQRIAEIDPDAKGISLSQWFRTGVQPSGMSDEVFQFLESDPMATSVRNARMRQAYLDEMAITRELEPKDVYRLELGEQRAFGAEDAAQHYRETGVLTPWWRHALGKEEKIPMRRTTGGQLEEMTLDTEYSVKDIAEILDYLDAAEASTIGE